MTTKDYLRQINRLDTMINTKLSEISNLEHTATSISVNNSSERVQTSGNKDKVGNAVAKIIDLEREIDEIVDRLVDTRRKIVSQIEEIEDNDYCRILSEYYIQGKNLTDIGRGMYLSYRQIKRLYDMAILEFERLYGNEYLDKTAKQVRNVS